MKYKHIYSAIHNFGHSFTSLMNYVDDDYVIDELDKIHTEGNDIEVDWLTGQFKPVTLVTPRIQKSIGYWRDSLKKHMASQNVSVSTCRRLTIEARNTKPMSMRLSNFLPNPAVERGCAKVRSPILLRRASPSTP